MMRLLYVISLFIPLIFLNSGCSRHSEGTGIPGNAIYSSSLINEIEKNYGISLAPIYHPEQLPPSVRAKRENNEMTVRLEHATEEQLGLYLPIIENALNKYPAQVIRDNVEAIYIGGSYKENGMAVSGLYSSRGIYLFYNDNNNTTLLFLEQTFHLELSSLLIAHYDFPAFQWLEANREDFSYIVDQREIDRYMRRVRAYGADDSLLEQRLVSTYGRTNGENDINTYAELVFTDPQRVKSHIGNYPIVRRKYLILKSFYLSISEDFEDVFRNIEGEIDGGGAARSFGSLSDVISLFLCYAVLL